MGGEDRRGGEGGEDGVSERRTRGMRKKEGLMTDDGGMDGRKEGAFLFVFVTHVCFVFLHRERTDEEARSPQVGSNRRNQNPTAVMMRVVLYTSPHTTAFAW